MTADADMQQPEEAPLRRPGLRRVILGIAALAFAAGIYIALENAPLSLDDLRWLPSLLVVILLMPINLLLNGREFQLACRLFERTPTLGEAVETTVIGSAANLLPLPGATLVRLAKMKALGISLKQGSLMTAALAVIWFLTTLVLAGGWLMLQDGPLWFMGLLPAGLAGFAAAFLLFARRGFHLAVLFEIVLVRVALVLLDAAALYLCFLALSDAVGYGETLALAASGFLGAAVSVVPAGLGVREAAAAAIASLIAVSSAKTYLAAALYRLLGLIAILPAALLLNMRRQKAVSDKP